MAEKKLRLKDSKNGKRLDGKLLLVDQVTHEQAQALSNRGYANWFRLVPANEHPCVQEREKAAKDHQESRSNQKPVPSPRLELDTPSEAENASKYKSPKKSKESKEADE